MSRNIRIVAYFVLVLLSLTCLGCLEKESATQAISVPLPKLQRDNDLGHISEAVQVNVFIDGTMSMKGFVSENDSTNYMHLLHQLEGSLINNWKKCELKFYKFGSKIVPLSARSHLYSIEPSFYQEQSVSSETRIDKILVNEENYQLNVVNLIVTDLFQKDADAVLLTNLIRERCLVKGLAVGIIGFKSQFNGRIFDVGLRCKTYSYASSDDPKSYRPFYLLVIGRHEDVASVCERLKAIVPKDSNPNMSIISKFILSKMTTFEGAQRVNDKDNLNKNLNKVENIVNDPNGRFRQLRLVDDDAKGAVNYVVKLFKAPFVIEFNQKTLEVQIQGESYSGTSSIVPSSALLVNMSNVMYDFKGNGSKEDALKLSLTVNNKEIQDNSIYRYHVVGYHSKNSIKEPFWWNSWSMDVKEVLSYKNNKNESFDGSKTQNLSMFLSGISQANFILNKPKVFDSYVYVRK